MESYNIYSLDNNNNNNNNYKYELMHSSYNIFKIYVDILTSYNSEYTNSKSIHLIYKKNVNLYYYLYEKGINTICHIFKILLINTKNVDLVKYYCMKTINYYIKFIEQNNTQEEDKIKYTHASLFSYVNTIYKLNKAYRKNAENILDETVAFIIHTNEEKEKSIFKNVDIIIHLYNIHLYNKQLNYDIAHTQDINNNTIFIENIEHLYQEYKNSHEINFEYEKYMEKKLECITLMQLYSINNK